jgi:sterol desaturase/sphingolipid hydroxylase (fatty acid hydroxylase superfamily)
LTFGSVLALTYYEWVHYVAHIPFTPVTPFGRWMKKYHLWHHFKNEHLWFGVTSPSMDFVMATYQPVNEAERSATVRQPRSW